MIKPVAKIENQGFVCLTQWYRTNSIKSAYIFQLSYKFNALSTEKKVVVKETEFIFYKNVATIFGGNEWVLWGSKHISNIEPPPMNHSHSFTFDNRETGIKKWTENSPARTTRITWLQQLGRQVSF